ncbi:hypothetical protein P20439_1466 [Pseudoalteromonas sp. BSi20439]|nr:hypothetical protein P20439_1466 [Pseudoalteromonas sp. BSi20439]
MDQVGWIEHSETQRELMIKSSYKVMNYCGLSFMTIIFAVIVFL